MDLVKRTTVSTEQLPHGWKHLSSGAALSEVLTTDYTDYTDISNSPIREIRVISGQIFEENSWAVAGSMASEYLWQNHGWQNHSGGAGLLKRGYTAACEGADRKSCQRNQMISDSSTEVTERGMFRLMDRLIPEAYAAVLGPGWHESGLPLSPACAGLRLTGRPDRQTARHETACFIFVYGLTVQSNLRFSTSNVHCPLFTFHCPLFTVRFPLVAGHWSLVTGHWSRVTGHRPLSTVHFSSITVHFQLFTVYCSLFTVHFPPPTVHCSLISTRAPMPSARHDPYQAMRFAPFRWYVLGGVLIRIGTAIQGVAIGWEMYDRTDDALALGVVGLVQAVPMLLFTLPAGYLADVVDRRKLIFWSLAGSTLTSLLLAVFSLRQGSIGVMYVLLFLDSTFNRLGWPARSAVVPMLVPREAFENAVKLGSTLMQVAGMVGPALGGFVVAWRLPAAYGICAATSLLFMGFLGRVNLAEAERTPPGRMWRQLGEGILFVRRQPLLLGAISLDLFAVLLGGAVYLLPIYTRDLISLSGTGLSPEQALGWLRAAPAAGALCMALILTHLPPMRHAGRNMLLAVAGFGLATIVFGISRNLWLSMVMLFLTGLFDMVSVVVRQTLVQLATPNEMRGRVSAVNAIFIGSSNELGGFESGLVARLFSPVFSVVSGGLGTLAVVAIWTGAFPALRRVKSLDNPAALPTTPVAPAGRADDPHASSS